MMMDIRAAATALYEGGYGPDDVEAVMNATGAEEWEAEAICQLIEILAEEDDSQPEEEDYSFDYPEYPTSPYL